VGFRCACAACRTRLVQRQEDTQNERA
jgi:hypothetical protein